MPQSMSQTPVSRASLVKIVDGDVGDEFSFQFNFPEIQRGLNADYTFISPPGSMLPTAVYKSTVGQEMSFSIMVDATENPPLDSMGFSLGVMPDLAFFESLVCPEVDTYLESNARWIAPARLIFLVGTRAWDVVCLSVKQTEVIYDRSMIPYRATIDITLKSIYVDSSTTDVYLREMKKMFSNTSRLLKNGRS
jgi:hypothetical protein